MSLIKQIEKQAIEFFGEDVIGTKDLREKLPQEQKDEVLNWLVQRYVQLTGSFGVFF